MAKKAEAIFSSVSFEQGPESGEDKMNKVYRNEEDKKVDIKSLDQVLQTNTSSKSKTIKIPTDVHTTIDFLSLASGYSIQDIGCNILELFLRQNKEEVSKLIQKAVKLKLK